MAFDTINVQNKYRVTMRAEHYQACSYQQLQELHDAYTNIVDVYEDILGGPRNCAGIPEYMGAMRAVKNIRKLIKERANIWLMEQ